MPANEITSVDEFKQVIQGDKVVVVLYEGSAPHADSIADNHPNSAKYYKIDVAKHPSVKEKFGISTVPTTIIYNGGKESLKVEGGGQDNLAKLKQALS